MKFINTLLKTTLLLFVISFSSCKDENPQKLASNSGFNSSFCKLTKTIQSGQTNSTTNYTWDGNTCTGDNGYVAEYNNYGEVVRSESNGITNVYEYKDCSNFCKLTKTVQSGQTNLTINYTWDGNTRTGNDGSVAEFNESGEMIRLIANGITYLWEYNDCNNFCKLTKSSYSGQGLNYTTNYKWIGNTQIGDDGTEIKFNNSGEMTKYEGNGVTIIYEYKDCN